MELTWVRVDRYSIGVGYVNISRRLNAGVSAIMMAQHYASRRSIYRILGIIFFIFNLRAPELLVSIFHSFKASISNIAQFPASISRIKHFSPII